MASSDSIYRDLMSASRDLADAKSRRNQAIREYERGPATDRLKSAIEAAERDIRSYERQVDRLQREYDAAKREEAKAKRGR